jgi:dTDP-4-dehydrorhamnose reductase
MSTVKNLQRFKPELWGGLECTINRIGDNFRDQLVYTGHYHRPDDIARFAALGITAMRYPLLWERHQPEPDCNIDWTWAQDQLDLMKQYKILPIAGLVHHGSGPRFTGLLDEHFSAKLASYAHSLAVRFPELEYFTPVNEPLTTARFSGLYGLWFPHRSDTRSFVVMLLNQLKGVVLSMQAIRKINSKAKLIQTEDMAKVHSTPFLRYQADFENERRWLTFDLLCGKVTSHHPLWNYLVSIGIPESSLAFFLENVCPPDILGLNYYVTSERYLDERTEHYPGHPPGGNDVHQYCDSDAVRAGKAEGLKTLLPEVWNRYHRPMAITEAHLCCTREEQMRWLQEIWDDCCGMNQKEKRVQSVTAWSLLGAYDWNSLLTKENMYYESGVFDARDNQTPRKTAIAKQIFSLSQKGEYHHPLLENQGWWRRPWTQSALASAGQKPLLIIGKNGTLGNAFARICDQRNISYRALSQQDLNITAAHEIESAINLYKPWAIINATGYAKVDQAETETEECYLVNTTGSWLLAKACRRWGLPYMTFSSHLVFNGQKNAPYVETDFVNPLNHYGRSKAQAEAQILAHYSSSLIVRSGAFFGPWDHHNFAHNVLESLQHGTECLVANDVIVSPTYIPDLVNSAMDLFIDEETGIWHIANEGILSWSEFAYALALRGGYQKEKIITRCQADMPWKASRPRYSALQSGKGVTLPTLECALENYFKGRQPS